MASSQEYLQQVETVSDICPMYTVLDLDCWPRRALFEWYKNYEDPFFNITAPVDVTTAFQRCKDEGGSFFLDSLFYATQAANDVEAFRLRLLHDQVVAYHTVHCGSTVFMPDKTFRFCYFDYMPDRPTFTRSARSSIEAEQQKTMLDPRIDALDLLHFSVMPWVSFTGLKHARKQIPGDTIPKIVFGKYYHQGGRLLMPLSVDGHHAMMDGYHVGLYFERFQALLDG